MIRAFFAVLLAIAVLVPTPVLAAQTPDFPTTAPTGHWYTQTNGYPIPNVLGYGVFDFPTVKIWSEFQRLGGVDVLGYPISGEFYLDGYTSQAFQKAILQWHPETGHVAFINIFDRLHDLGKDAYLQSARQIPPPLNTSGDTGKSWTHVVASHQALLSGNAALQAAYFADSDPIDHYGLPMTGPVDEGNVIVVRCQRAVLQQWKSAEPWAAAGQVTVANGGDIAKEVGLVPRYEDVAFAPDFAWVSGGPIRKDSDTVMLQFVDLGPGWGYLPILPPGLAITPANSVADGHTPPAAAQPPPTTASGEIVDPGINDPVWLQVLQHGLVNRTTFHYAQSTTTKVTTVLTQQTDAFQSTDAAHWNYARRLGLLGQGGAGAQMVPIPAIGDESSGWKGQGTRVNGDATTWYEVVFRAGNLTSIVLISYLTDPGSIDATAHLAQLSLQRIQAP